MPHKTPRFTMNLIVESLCAKRDPKIIAEENRVHLATVYRIWKNLKNFDDPEAPRTAVSRSRLTYEAKEGVRDFVQAYPTAHLDEMVIFVEKKYEIEVSISTLSRTLKKLGISRKKISLPSK